jgi:hypothetical protein
VTTGRPQPTYPTNAGAYAAAQRAYGPPPRCDEVLAARLADGLLRLEWLGATLERLLRRLVRRPTG